MPNDLMARYRQITELIERATMDYLMAQAIDAFSEKPRVKSSAEIYEQTACKKTLTIALYALRILCNMELILQGDRQFSEQFAKDVKAALDAVSWLAGKSRKSDELISGTIALILLSSPDSASKLLGLLRSELGIAVKRLTSIGAEIFRVGIGVLRYYFDNQMFDELRASAESLVALSSRYNRFKPELHRTVVAQCLSHIIDIDFQIALRICEKQKSHFARSADAPSAEFYWFFAYACQILGKEEEAIPLHLHCSELCFRLEGANSWLAARSLQMYHRILLRKDKSGRSEEFLWDFIKKAETGFYKVNGDFVKLEAALVRYDLLRMHMDDQSLKDYFDEVRKYFDFCTEHEAILKHPLVTVRTAANMMGTYYLEIGDYLQAGQLMYAALNAALPEGVPETLSDDLIMSNLLQIYTQLNDLEQMEKLADMLAEKLDKEDLPDYKRYRYFVLIQSAYAQLGYSMDVVIQDFKESLMDTYEAMMDGDTEELDAGGIPCANSVVMMIVAIGDAFSSTRKELHCYQAIIRHFLDNPDIFTFNNIQLMLIYQELARIYWCLNHNDAIRYMQKSLDYGRSIVDFNSARIANLRIASVIYYNMGYHETAVAIAEKSLNNIADAWHNVMSYINDRRICQVLETSQENYNAFYAVISAEKSPEYVYDQLLRNKDLPSLVGRERNRYLNEAQIDRKLRDRVYALQDKLANAQMSDALSGIDTASEIFRELQTAETEFSKKFPRNVHYTEISFEKLGQKLGENEAILEYYFAPGKALLSDAPRDMVPVELNIFIITKRCGKVSLARTSHTDGKKILEDAVAFIDTMQNPEDSEWIGNKEALRESLSHVLLEFAIGKLDGISTLYIAPDQSLCNLPFEILYSSNGNFLYENFKICRLICGRDLIFFDDSPTNGTDAFVLGDPDFEAEGGERFSDRRRHAAGHLALVQDLPFSGLEAQRIACRCRTTPLLGKASTKFALQEALPCRIIHLATHGNFDETLESDSLYSSYLIFAGYNQWIKNKTQSRYCGNGILTADEISRMDLRQTELVVLSACNSGMGDYSYRSVQGLLSAFSAAGVRWVISHIWEADDFTTPILMDAFYLAYISNGMDVPEALQYAKNYLRTITIGELRRGGWLNPGIDSRLSSQTVKGLQAMQAANDRWRPFMDERYWGGFVCYKCK